MQVIANATDFTPPPPGQPSQYIERLSVPDLSFGTYSIPKGGVDPQSPHSEDELYVITAGRATLVCDSGSVEVGPGSAVFVPAHEGRRFVDITSDLVALVFFGPAEGTRGPR